MRFPWTKEEEPKFRTEPRKGKAYVITTEDDVVSLETLEKYQIQKFKIPGLNVDPVVISQQDMKLKEFELVAHPFDMPPLMELCESNVTLGAIVAQIATDVAGLGHTLPLKTDASENLAELKKIEDFLEMPNSERLSLQYILNAMTDDWGCVGNQALEVIWNAGGEVAEIRHLPVHNIWIHKSGDKYARLTKKGTTINQRWYRRFGIKAEDAEGNPIAAPNITQDTGKPGEEFKARATDVIYMHRYYRKSKHYGIPKSIPSLGEILSLIGIRDYHLGFLRNHGVPAYMVQARGEWDSGNVLKTIKEFMNKGVLRGGEAYATLMVEVPEEGSLEFEPLAIKESNTGNTFRVYKASLQEDVLSAYSMPPYRIGINQVGKLGGTNIKPATKIYKNGVVSPLQEDLEHMINMVLREGLNVESYRFDLNEMDASDEITPDDIDRLRRTAVITANEGRLLLEQKTPIPLEPYEAGNVFHIEERLIQEGEVEPSTDGSGG